jgi:hypothetical protein
METSTWPRCARDKPHADVASIVHLFPLGAGHRSSGATAWSRPDRISHAGTILSVTMRDRDGLSPAFRDAATAQVTATADQDAAGVAKVTAVFIKCCRTVLTEPCRYITK